MNSDLVRRVWQRANGLCEYCQLCSLIHPAPFQLDHIIARQHGGGTTLENLALSCLHCNRYKGPNIAGIDPYNSEIVRLFHPRQDVWADHFFWSGAELQATTSVGRATIHVLFINDPETVLLRQMLLEEGRFP